MWQTTLIAQECAIASPVILTASMAPAACQVTKLILPLLKKNNVDIAEVQKNGKRRFSSFGRKWTDQTKKDKLLMITPDEKRTS